MIDTKVKEAWKLSQLPCSRDIYPGVLADAYIEAEWQRRRAEFYLEHQDVESRCSYCRYVKNQPLDVKHNFIDDDWRTEVIAEVEG